MKIEVCILAGGKSRRMGRPKAEMLLDGSPLLDWSKRIARGAALPYRVIDQDLAESRGPISGIQTALKTTRADAVIFLPCDMPFVRSSTLRRLEPSTFAATSEGVGFPLMLARDCAVAGESLQALARQLHAKRVPLLPEEAFNINTPADFRAAERMLAEMAKDRVLDVDCLGIRRGDVAILKNISWQVCKGEHWAILGANGSGKTSLLSALTGFLSPTSGRIRLLGQEFGRSDWRELRKHVGFVSSSLRQLMADAETALETVVSGKEGMIDRWGPLKRVDQKAGRDLLARIGCLHLEKRVWAVLSQGERQRVLIGRALMAAPEVLILDEPCAGLDPAAREDFLAFVQGLTALGGPSIIFVTHHVEEIVHGITHVLALKGGEIVVRAPKRMALNTKRLQEIFSCKARLIRTGQSFRMIVRPLKKGSSLLRGFGS